MSFWEYQMVIDIIMKYLYLYMVQHNLVNILGDWNDLPQKVLATWNYHDFSTYLGNMGNQTLKRTNTLRSAEQWEHWILIGRNAP